MRMPMIAAGIAALLAADGAGAQRMVMAGPGTASQAARVDSRYVGTAGSRWGSRVDGRWWAGVNAPGGWHAYHRPYRGWILPGYWLASDYAIDDWATYGLGAPPAGYGWTRYYDDAVLIDGNGRVYDSVGNVDWDRGDRYYAADAGTTAVTYSQPVPYAPAPYAAAPAYAPGAGYAPPPPPAYAEQRNSGVGGALIGAALGAGAGYAIGGRGNRVAGSLIGAGVGGAAGYAIDRSSYHRVPVAPPVPNPGYAPPPPGAYPPPPGAYPPPPPPAAGTWRSPDGGTVITTTSAGGVYGGSTTTITVQTAPVVTTTTTEIVEDRVTYTRHRPVRHKWVRRVPACGCR